MQQSLAYILQTLFQHEVFVITPALNHRSCDHVACVAGLLNIGLQQSQGNLVFRGRERTHNVCQNTHQSLWRNAYTLSRKAYISVYF